MFGNAVYFDSVKTSFCSGFQLAQGIMESPGQVLSFPGTPVMEKEDAGFFVEHVIMDGQNIYPVFAESSDDRIHLIR